MVGLDSLVWFRAFFGRSGEDCFSTEIVDLTCVRENIWSA